MVTLGGMGLATGYREVFPKKISGLFGEVILFQQDTG
jgi:hypothetical protein